MRPPSAGLCCHPVQRNAATFGDHQRVCKSHPRRRRAVGLGRCAVRAQGSKVRFADHSPGTQRTPYYRLIREYLLAVKWPPLASPSNHLLPVCNGNLYYLREGLTRSAIPRLKGEAVKNGREVRSQGGNRRCFRDVTIMLSLFQAIQDGLRYLAAYG